MLNKRIDNLIENFYDSMKDFFTQKQWKWSNFVAKKDEWVHPDYGIKIISRYNDSAYRVLEYTLKNTPSLVEFHQGRKYNFLYTHIFEINIPREYPANLGNIEINVKKGIPFHPRVIKNMKACIVINGEIDRILEELIFHALLKPEKIRPPSLFPGEDFGMNSNKMRLYEIHYEEIVSVLETKWDEKHEKQEKTKVKSGIKILPLDKEEKKKLPPDNKKKKIKILPLKDKRKVKIFDR